MTDKEVRENAAANAVLSHLSAVLGSPMAARRWDDGSARSMHDFYIEGGDNRIALEVTTMADGQRVGRDLRWTQAAPGGWIKV